MKLSVKKTLGITAFSAMLMATTSGWSMDDKVDNSTGVEQFQPSRMESSYDFEVESVLSEDDRTVSSSVRSPVVIAGEEAVSDDDIRADPAPIAAGEAAEEVVAGNDNNGSTESAGVEAPANNGTETEETPVNKTMQQQQLYKELRENQLITTQQQRPSSKS